MAIGLSTLLVDSGSILMTFGALETALRFDDVPWSPGCVADIRAGRKWVVSTSFRVPLNQLDSIAADSM